MIKNTPIIKNIYYVNAINIHTVKFCIITTTSQLSLNIKRVN